jgi:hypothetical protein
VYWTDRAAAGRQKVLPVRGRLILFGEVARHAHQVDRLARQPERGSVGGRQLDYLVQQHGHARSGRLDLRQPFGQPLTVERLRPPEALLQELGSAADARERVIQVVRQAGEQRAVVLLLLW